jgi:hypothetical protein
VDDLEILPAEIPKRGAIPNGIDIHIVEGLIVQHSSVSWVECTYVKLAAGRLLQLALELPHRGGLGVWMLP